MGAQIAIPWFLAKARRNQPLARSPGEGLFFFERRNFLKKYGVKHLVYYEFFDSMPAAIRREKRLKEWQRAGKVRLSLSMNPTWGNLFDPETGEINDGPADLVR